VYISSFLIEMATTVKDVPAHKFITVLAAHLKKSGKFDLPVNSDLIKTGTHAELPPQDADWYYVRLASLFRRVYLHSGVGVGALRRMYGGCGATGTGTHKKHHIDAAGGNIRFALKALEKAKFVAQKDGQTGRFLTSAGRRELDSLAASIKVEKVLF
jgi:small subunit ribosomal protein S19e